MSEARLSLSASSVLSANSVLSLGPACLRWYASAAYAIPAMGRRAASHLISPKVLIRESLKPLAQFFTRGFFGDRAGNLGALQYFVLHKNRAIDAQRQRQRIARPRVDGHNLAVALHPNQRIKSIVLQVVDNHLLHP